MQMLGAPVLIPNKCYFGLKLIRVVNTQQQIIIKADLSY